jgi:hypothetical protein
LIGCARVKTRDRMGWEKYFLTRQLKLNISDVDLSILKVSGKYINLNKSILEF